MPHISQPPPKATYTGHLCFLPDTHQANQSNLKNQVSRIGHVTQYQNSAFHAGNGTLGKKQAEKPHQNTRYHQSKQIKIGYAREMKGSDAGAASQHKEDIKQIATNHIANSYLRILLQSRYDGSSKFRKRRSACHQGKTDYRFADSQTAGNACSSIHKQLSAIHKRSQTTENINHRFPPRKQFDFFFSATFGRCLSGGKSDGERYSP